MSNDIPPGSVASYATGYSSATFIALSSLVLLAYDNVTTLDQEIEYFWEGDWNCTRSLYFLNRYLPPSCFLLQLFCPVCLRNCTEAIRASISLEVVGMLIAEGVLMLRVFYLWSHSKPTQHFLCVMFALCAGVALTFAGKAIHALHGQSHLTGFPGCFNIGDSLYWPIFIAVFLLQSILFAATITRILRPMKATRSKAVVKRLLRDGVIFYFVVLVSVGFSLVGSALVNDPIIAVPALVSNLSLALHSICASHLMLSIHSLAADLGSDPRFLLSNLEISRVMWRRGSRANELVVEIDVDSHDVGPPPIELSELDFGVVDARALRETHSRGPLMSPQRGAFPRAEAYAQRGINTGPRIYVERSDEQF